MLLNKSMMIRYMIAKRVEAELNYKKKRHRDIKNKFGAAYRK
jgi:hypothetical protein